MEIFVLLASLVITGFGMMLTSAVGYCITGWVLGISVTLLSAKVWLGALASAVIAIVLLSITTAFGELAKKI